MLKTFNPFLKKCVWIDDNISTCYEFLFYAHYSELKAENKKSEVYISANYLNQTFHRKIIFEQYDLAKMEFTTM
jgi:hypothetical protein